MSQHYCITKMGNKFVEVVMGWDRPLQCFFMRVFFMHEENEDKLVAYSDLNDPTRGPKSMDYFMDKLDDLGIAVPHSMIAEIIEDQSWNVGNKMRRHDMCVDWPPPEGEPLQRAA